MNDIFRTVLSLSLSGSVIAIILFAVKPFLKDRISKTWQYYIWLVVILRLLIPFTSEINILNGLFNSTEINVIDPIDNVSPNNKIANEKSLNEIEISQNVIEKDIVSDNISSTKIFDGYLSAIQGNAWLVWSFISAILLLKKIISYHVYVHYIKLNRKIITDENIITTYDEVCDKAGMTRKIGLYSYKKINSPMLIGFMKPFILLPETMLKTTDGLQYILLHELTHYRRLDFLYKWLVQIAVCVHFFNPTVYFVRKSINRACEFSCDEMVIKKLDEQSKKAYGTALIDALELSAGYNQPAISFMLCEDVKIIKERLGAIMKYKKGNRFMLVITTFLTAAISFSAIFTGAYAATSTAKTDKDKVIGEQISGERKIIPAPVVNKDDSKKIIVNIPSVSGKTFVKNYGKYHLIKDEKILADLNWNGNGAVMFLYTKDVFSTKDIISLVGKGILPLNANNKTFNNGADKVPSLSSNFTYVKNNKELKLNFTTTPNKPIYWTNQAPDTGDYFIYIIATGDTDITDIQGNIILSEIKTGKKLTPMNAWSGSADETKTDTGVKFQASSWTGDKTSYDFFVGDKNSKNFKFNSFLVGEYDIVFTTSDRTIIKTIPSFSGTKDITLDNLPKGTVRIIIYSHNVSGTLYIESLDKE